MRYSVVMPAHRADGLLSQALASVQIAAEGDEAEIIVVANGPHRDRIVEQVSKMDTSKKVYTVKSEIPSLVYCLNRAIEIARGEFIARCDSDDLCLPDRFKRQYQLAKEGGIDFLFSDAEVVGQDGQQASGNISSHIELWRRCGPIHPTAFIRRAALLELGGYGNLEYSEDYHLWLRASARGFRFAVDHRPAIKYRLHPEQATDKRRLAHTFATNIGIKVTHGLRERRPAIFVGSLVDAGNLIIRKCKDAFY